jgi:hypothetical protein
MDVDLGYLWSCLASLIRKNTHQVVRMLYSIQEIEVRDSILV